MVIDTNVPLVANGLHPPASDDCIRACTQVLSEVRSGLIVIDDDGLILAEYKNHLSHRGQPGVGDAFFKWLWDNQANPHRCRRVPITYDAECGRDFLEFPDDPDLHGFDHSDRKFVAVAIASGINPAIVNAADTDWHIFRTPLERYVRISFICPELME